MSEREDDEAPAGEPVGATGDTQTSEAAAPDPPRHVAPGGRMPAFPDRPGFPETTGLAGLAAAANFGSPSATDSIARAITALNRPALIPASDWQRQLMPKFDIPKFDLPTFDLPTFDLPRQFDISGYDFAARTRELMGIDSVMAGRNIADVYLRGLGEIGAGQAFTRAIEAISGHQDIGISAPDFLGDSMGITARDFLGAAAAGRDYASTRYFHDIATGPSNFARWLDASVPRVDMSAYAKVIGTASAVSMSMHEAISAAARAMFDISSANDQLNGLVAPALRNMRSPLDELSSLAPPFVQPAAAMWSTRITELMHGWSVLSELGHRLSGKALHLAVITRDALINNTDRDAVREAVIRFMHHVLGYKVWYPADARIDPVISAEARIEAVISALLDNSWLPAAGTPLDDCNPRDQIRELTKYQHSLWLPLGFTKRRGHRITSLDKPVPRCQTSDHDWSTTSPLDRLTAAEFTSAQQPVTHPVLKRLMEPLSPNEQEIVWARYHDGARTWADAATMCGRPPRDGETVRRKFLKLKNAELQRRSA